MDDSDLSKTEFEELLQTRLVPEFVSDQGRRLSSHSADRLSGSRVTDYDAKWFVTAFKSELVTHISRGLYRAPRSFASEQYFWTSRAADGLLSMTLWIEPIITVAAVGRLCIEFGWPTKDVGTQSRDWAFDAATYLGGNANEHIACEVKKSISEVDLLIKLMSDFGAKPAACCPPPTKSKARNAFRKLAALRERQIPIFWALGPGGYSLPHLVVHSPDKRVTLVKMDDMILRCPIALQPSVLQNPAASPSIAAASNFS